MFSQVPVFALLILLTTYIDHSTVIKCVCPSITHVKYSPASLQPNKTLITLSSSLLFIQISSAPPLLQKGPLFLSLIPKVNKILPKNFKMPSFYFVWPKKGIVVNQWSPFYVLNSPHYVQLTTKPYLHNPINHVIQSVNVLTKPVHNESIVLLFYLIN